MNIKTLIIVNHEVLKFVRPRIVPYHEDELTGETGEELCHNFTIAESIIDDFLEFIDAVKAQQKNLCRACKNKEV